MRAALLAPVLVLVGCGAPARPAAPRNDLGARWAEVHELIDRYDLARFRRGAGERAALLRALGVRDRGSDPAARARTTNAVIDALLVRVDAILSRDRLHAGAQAARTLLEQDRRPPVARAELYAWMSALKSVARGGGPLAANAILRLAAFCDRAFHDAVAAPARARPFILATCLYPLYDSDPEPYFDPDPARRPPEPAWQDLRDALDELLATLAAKDKSRVAVLAATLRAGEQALVRDAVASGALAPRLDPRALGLPQVVDPPRAEPYDWEPLILVHDPTPAEMAKHKDELRGLLEADGRRRVALALRGDQAARALLDMAALVRSLGAETVELAVGWQQAVRPPAGDYWFGRAPGGRVPRVGVLPLALDPARLAPRAALGLRLVVSPRRWQIVSPSGALPAIPVGADPAPACARLRAQVRRLLDAFPDEGALAVTPDPAVTAGALASALHAVLRDESGARLLGALALAPGPAPAPAAGDLAARARRRSAARVTLVPDALASRAPAVRRCLQDAADHGPAPTGTLALEQAGGHARVIAGPKDPALRRCVVERLERAMVAGGIPDARVELRGE